MRLRSFLLLTIALLAAAPLAAQRISLNDLGTARYLGFQGGLYENGADVPPFEHAEAGLRIARSIQPLDGTGNPASGGKIVMISIGMSNTTQEFCVATSTGPCTAWSFVGQAMAHPAVNRSTLLIVNGARGGQTAATWDAASDPNYDVLRDRHLAPAGATEKQVQVAWVKVANPQPLRSLPASDADAYRLVEQTGGIVRALRVRYPNIRIVYLSSRIYAGYATTSLNPEPYAYESAFAVKWLIQAQIDQMRNAAVTDVRAGDLNYDTVSPWLAWGPYLWADGLNPRSDGLIWTRGDLEGDGTHPTQSGEQKVGALLLSFLLNDPTARPWFVSSDVGRRRRAVRAP